MKHLLNLVKNNVEEVIAIETLVLISLLGLLTAVLAPVYPLFAMGLFVVVYLVSVVIYAGTETEE